MFTYYYKIRKLILITIAAFLTSCGGGGDDSQENTAPVSPGTNNNPPPTIPSELNQNQALLGAVHGASVQVYELTDTAFTSPIASTTTSSFLSATDIGGWFELTINDFPEQSWVVVRVSGGEDVDANDDGITDEVPTPVEGAFFGLATVEDINNGDIIVNPLTDMLFLQLTESEDLAALSAVDLGILLDERSSEYVGDVNDDGTITYQDMLLFTPSEHSEEYSAFNWDVVLAQYVSAIHNNLSTNLRQQVFNSALILTNVETIELTNDEVISTDSTHLDNITYTRTSIENSAQEIVEKVILASKL